MSNTMVNAIRTSDQVVAERVGEEMVLVHLESNKIYELNATAARFWELAAETGDLDRVRVALRDEFDVTPEELEAEIARFVETALQDKLLVVEQP